MSPKSPEQHQHSTAAAAAYYYYLPNPQTLDSWVQPTIIEDEDLTFGGKSLSVWYEEERRRLSSGNSSDDERRGRERVRRRYHGKGQK